MKSMPDYEGWFDERQEGDSCATYDAPGAPGAQLVFRNSRTAKHFRLSASPEIYTIFIESTGVMNSTPIVRQYGILLTNGVLFYAKRETK